MLPDKAASTKRLKVGISKAEKPAAVMLLILPLNRKVIT